MHVISRIDEVLTMLERFALGEIDLPKQRVTAALRLLDLALDDAPPPPDGGDEAPILADTDDPAVLVFPARVAA
jgi:hypothetical protein